MDSRQYSSRLCNEAYWGRRWMLVAMLLALSNFALIGFALFNREQQRVILLPPKLERAVWLQGAEVSDSYLEQMAVYMVELSFSYHPENVHYRVRQFLRHAAPHAYAALADSMRRDADSVRRNNVSAVFHPKSVQLRAPQRKAVVSGLQTRMVGGKSLDQRELSVLVSFSSGNDLLITQMQEVPENALDPFVVMPGHGSG